MTVEGTQHSQLFPVGTVIKCVVVLNDSNEAMNVLLSKMDVVAHKLKSKLVVTLKALKFSKSRVFFLFIEKFK